MSSPSTSTRDDTIVVVTTPPGRGAVAVIVVEGNSATECVNACVELATGSALSERAIDRILFGRWIGVQFDKSVGVPDQAATSGRAEEIVVCRRANDRVEIHCHGGRAAVARIVGDVVSLGCRELDPAAWRLASAGDKTVVEAELALAQATTQRTAAILLAQRAGALSTAIAQISRELETNRNAAAMASIDALLATAAIGLHLVSPWKVVLAGPPNVGKSCLLNALLGYDRALVFDRPGTTRDIVTATTALDGWPIALSDTAGVRASTDPLEQAGIERASVAVAECDLLITVSDATQPATGARLFDDYSGPRIDVRNKADLCPGPRDLPHVFYTSATRGDGIAELAAAILMQLAPQPPGPGAPVVFTQRQLQLFQHARAAIADSQTAKALEILREIVG